MHIDKQRRPPREAPTYGGENQRRLQALCYAWWQARDFVPAQMDIEDDIRAMGYEVTYSPTLHKLTATRLENGAGR